MNQRGKGRIAKALVLVMLTVFLCGSTAMAQESRSTDWPYVGEIEAGAIIRGISAGGPGGKYVDYDFYVGGKQYFCSSDNNVHLNRYYKVTGVAVDDVNKTVNVSGDQMIQFEIAETTSLKQIGDTVTLNLAQEYKEELDKYKDNEFIKWYVWAWRSNGLQEGYQKKFTQEESASMLGVTPETLEKKECSITFAIPAEWEDYMIVGIDPAFDNSTISGNIPPEPDRNESAGTSSDSGRTTKAEPIAQNNVVLSNGTRLNSAGAIHNVAAGINGAAVMTLQEEMNTRAGLSSQNVEAGANAKLYVGSTYKKAEKAALTDAVSQTGAKAITLINIDLYTIGKTGIVNSIVKLQGEEAVRIVIGLPADAVKEGRSFSLVYMDENGQAVEIPDLDNDPYTLTVDLTRFGSFAVIYR